MDDRILAFMRNLMQGAQPEEREAYEKFLQSCLDIMRSNVLGSFAPGAKGSVEPNATRDEGDER